MADPNRIEQAMPAKKALRLGWINPPPIPEPTPQPQAPRVILLDQLPHSLPTGSSADG